MPFGKRYPKSVRDLVDYDYLDKLSDKDKAWLEQFTEESYGATFGETPLIKDETEQRSLNAERNHRVADIWGKGLRKGVPPENLSWLADEGDKSFEPSPAYLGEEKYLTAVSNFRAFLPKDRRLAVLQGPAFEARREEIQRITRPEEWVETRGSRLGKSRLEKLQRSREVLFNLGVLLNKSTFTGGEAEAAVIMQSWVVKQINSLDAKLEAAGIKPPKGMEVPKYGQQ